MNKTLSKTKRRKIQITSVKDPSVIAGITNEEIMEESDKYDKESYNPLENIAEKEILVPNHRTETITIRLTEQEKETIAKKAEENGLNQSSYVRMIVKRYLKETEALYK
jgi:predicted DNA binding CopG/RHH family protein